jgi:ATP-dependent DNA helicase RecQ
VQPKQQDAQQRFAALKAWRAEVAREHTLPAYVIFHDATLLAMAVAAPQTLAELSGISVGNLHLELCIISLCRIDSSLRFIAR